MSKPAAIKKNVCTLVIKDTEDGMVNIKLTFKRALKKDVLLTPAEQVAFDALKSIKENV